MNRKIGVILFIFCLTVVLESCGGSRKEDDDFYCPSCDEIAGWGSYGNVFIDAFKNDKWGWKLCSSCGWQIYEDHKGGHGDTLELVSCNGGVVFIWAWNHFSAFYLSEGWTGSTLDGIKLGSSLEEFLTVYPNFTQYGEKSYVLRFNDDPDFEWAKGQVMAVFDDEDKLKSLHVFRGYLDGENNVTPFEDAGCLINSLEKK